MLESFIHNIFVMFDGRVFQSVQTVLLFSPTCFLIPTRQTSYRFLKKNEQKLARSFNFTFRYIDILSPNNSKLSDFVDCIYPIELEIKDITDTERSASYLGLLLELTAKSL